VKLPSIDLLVIGSTAQHHRRALNNFEAQQYYNSHAVFKFLYFQIVTRQRKMFAAKKEGTAVYILGKRCSKSSLSSV
jgi:hypothetical protein